MKFEERVQSRLFKHVNLMDEAKGTKISLARKQTNKKTIPNQPTAAPGSAAAPALLLLWLAVVIVVARASVLDLLLALPFGAPAFVDLGLVLRSVLFVASARCAPGRGKPGEASSFSAACTAAASASARSDLDEEQTPIYDASTSASKGSM